MSRWRETKIDEIEDELLRQFVAELEEACRIDAPPEKSIYFFLLNCVYPLGPGQRVPISTEGVPASPLLDERVGKLPDGPLLELCIELAGGESIEFFLGEKLRTFLNRRLPKFPEQKPLSEEALRRDALVHRRRGNR